MVQLSSSKETNHERIVHSIQKLARYRACSACDGRCRVHSRRLRRHGLSTVYKGCWLRLAYIIYRLGKYWDAKGKINELTALAEEE